MGIDFDLEKCTGCGNCIPACPFGLLEIVDDKLQLKEGCTLCGACRDVCPVKIDLPRLLLDLRGVAVERDASPKGERAAMRAYSAVMRRPARYRVLARLAAWLGPLAGLLPPLRVWRRSRSLPRFAARRFGARWRGRVPGDEEGAAG